MARPLLSSKWVTKKEPPKAVNIPGLVSAVPTIEGITERGPIGVATKITSWEEYREIFGDVTANSTAAIAVYLFFGEGGSQCYVIRTVHYTNIDQAASYTATKGSKNLSTDAIAPTAAQVQSDEDPFTLADGDNLVVEIVNGGESSGDLTTTFNGAAASRDSNDGPFVLENGDTLEFKIDRGNVQSVEFLTAEFVDIGAALAQEVANVINVKSFGCKAFVNGDIVQMQTDRKGTGAYIEFTGGTALAKLGFVADELQGTGNVLDLNSVAASEAAALIEAAIGEEGAATVVGGKVTIDSTLTGATSSVQVKAVSTADAKMGFDNVLHSGGTGGSVETATIEGKTAGDYTERIQVVIENATSGEVERFNLTVLLDGYSEELFANLTMDSEDDYYAPTIMNATSGGSNLLAFTDLEAEGTTLQRRPANGTFGSITGGDDGLDGLTDSDFVGSASAGNGLRAIDAIKDTDLLIVPHYSSTAVVANAMVQYCEVERDGLMFTVIDPPEGYSTAQIIDWFENDVQLTNVTEVAATYWPRIRITNKWTGVFGDEKTIVAPPSGAIVGHYALMDASKGGIYKTPAGSDEQGILYTARGFEGDTNTKHEVEDERKRDVIFPKRINPIRRDEGPIYLDGARCIKGDGNFPFVQQSRGTINIARSLMKGLDYTRHKRNSIKLRRRVERDTENFLNKEMDKNAFADNTPANAYFLDVSESLNKPSVRASGRIMVRIGLAYDDPAEFGVLLISRDTRQLESELAGELA